MMIPQGQKARAAGRTLSVGRKNSTTDKGVIVIRIGKLARF
jgi:hypothetical protein